MSLDFNLGDKQRHVEPLAERQSPGLEEVDLSLSKPPGIGILAALRMLLQLRGQREPNMPE